MQVTASDYYKKNEIRYIKAPSTIINGGAYPSWALTNDMIFELRKQSGDHYAIVSEIDGNPAMYALYAEEILNFKIFTSYFKDGGTLKHEFNLQNESDLA